MKTIQIIESAQAEELCAHIVLALGGSATDRPYVYECPDNTAAELIEAGHAIEPEPLPDHSAAIAFLEAGALRSDFYSSLLAQYQRKKDLSPRQWECVAKAMREAEQVASAPKSALHKWLEGYAGSDVFLCSLRTQLRSRGTLSEKQWACARKPFEEQEQVREFTIAVGTYIVVNRFEANRIALLAGCTRPHFGMSVLAVLGETKKAYELQLELVAMRAGACCVCGRTLTNPESIGNGIGPICADGWGLEWNEDSLAALAEKLKTLTSVTCWLPKKAIKERTVPNA